MIFVNPSPAKTRPSRLNKFLSLIKRRVCFFNFGSSFQVDELQYESLEEFKADFDLMISNCLAYNNKDTVFYRAGLKMRDQVSEVDLHLFLRRW